MIKHSLTQTLKYKQKHNQNNNKQKDLGDDVTKTTRYELNLEFRKIGTKIVPPQKFKQCYCVKFWKFKYKNYMFTKTN